MQIIHIPRAFVKPFDPREQAVTDESVEQAIADTNAVRQELGIPLHVRALRGDLPPNTCCACGCHIPLKPPQTSWPLGVLYGDPHREVTRAITYALATDCGPAVASFVSTLGADEALMLARQLSRVAVRAHLEELAK